MNKKWITILLILLLPIQVLAYSNKIIVGGETIGIEVHSEGVYVVGFYPVFQKETAKTVGFQKGDRIIQIDEQPIESIRDFNKVLKEAKTYTFIVERNEKRIQIDLPIQEENYLLKTGLYVKDQVNGIGTLSYIDPETKIYGSLGHEILENSSSKKLQIKDGTIYKAEVSSIEKSKNGKTGSKRARIQKDQEIGTIYKNAEEGIFGKYTDELEDSILIEVGKKEDIHKGEAILKTVIEEDKVEEFTINILGMDESTNNKNILFEITDKRLIDSTGGIIQGMSGSPILQDNKIIGVVNYVIVEDTKKGYGIFITTMLEKGDEILS